MKPFISFALLALVVVDGFKESSASLRGSDEGGHGERQDAELLSSYEDGAANAATHDENPAPAFEERNLQGSCGGGSQGDGVCADGTCCSQYGWCGTSAAHCAGGGTGGSGGGGGGGTCGGGSRGDGVCADGTCCSQYGWCGTSAAHCAGTGGGGSSGGGGTCGGGSRGDGVCADGTCCSQYGWCGTSAAHCANGGGTGGGGGCPAGWTPASWTYYQSFAPCCQGNPNYDPSASTTECTQYNACAYPGIFAYIGQQSFDFVKNNDITAFFSTHGNNSSFGRKKIRVSALGKTIEALVADTCGDHDCGGCCTRNAGSSGYLVDMEYNTVVRHFGSASAASGQVCWQLID